MEELSLVQSVIYLLLLLILLLLLTTFSIFRFQGPSTFQSPDIKIIPRLSHIYFFGRKFSTDVNDSIRQRVIDVVDKNLYQQEQKLALPQSFIK